MMVLIQKLLVSVGPILASIAFTCFTGYRKFQKQYPNRGTRPWGFWAAVLVLLTATAARTAIAKFVRQVDPFELFDIVPDPEGVEKLTTFVQKSFPGDDELQSVVDQISQMDLEVLTTLWPSLGVSTLRCPHCTSNTLSMVFMAFPPLLLRFVTYVAQIHVARYVCAAIGPLVGRFTLFGLVAILYETGLLFLGPSAFQYRKSLLFLSDLGLSLTISIYLSIELVYLRPNRLDPAKIVADVRAKLEATNRIHTASKSVVQEIYGSEDLRMLYGGWMRSLGGQPPLKADSGPVTLVKKNNEPPTYALGGL